MLPPSNLDWLIVLEAGAGVEWAGLRSAPNPAWGPTGVALCSCSELSAAVCSPLEERLAHPPSPASDGPVRAHGSLFIYSQFPIMSHVLVWGRHLLGAGDMTMNEMWLLNSISGQTLEGIQGVARPGEQRGQQAASYPRGSSTWRRGEGYPLSIRGPSLV